MSAVPQSSIVSKCVGILDLLAEADRPLGFSEIVRRSGFARSSTHRILSILLQQGMIEAESDKLYRLGPRVLNWAIRAWHGSDIQQAALAELEKLSETSGHNVAIAVGDDGGALYLRTVNQYHLRYVAQAGDRLPLHCTAVGKVLLAFMPQAQRGKLIGSLALEKYTEQTIVDRVSLERELEQVAAQGYAICDGEEFLQVCGIAAPVFDFQRDAAAAICIWSTMDRAGMSQLQTWLPSLLETCQRVSAKLGCR